MSLLLVAYDISDDRRRVRVTKVLARRGRRVQYSVFLLPRSEAAEVAAELAALIQPDQDNVRIHVLCEACNKKTLLLGVGRTMTEEMPFRVI